MRQLDETDLKILRLLTADARRPYSDIADEVELSPPTVADRVTRLQDLGIIRRFTVDIDRSKLSGGVPVLVWLSVDPNAIDEVEDDLVDADGVEHVFRSADAGLIFYARIQNGEVSGFLRDAVAMNRVREFDVTLLTDVSWTPQVVGTDFSLSCAECGNRVDADGESLRLDGEVYLLCCSSCKARFEDRYQTLRAGAES